MIAITLCDRQFVIITFIEVGAVGPVVPKIYYGIVFLFAYTKLLLPYIFWEGV